MKLPFLRIILLPFFLLISCNSEHYNIPPNKIVKITFTDQQGVHFENVKWSDNWGVLEENTGNYDCMGRCGEGCLDQNSHRRSIWSQACFSHDLCSYRNASRLGILDPNCGDEFLRAIFQSGLLFIATFF